MERLNIGSRVSVFLPVNDYAEQVAARQIAFFIQERHEGLTQSRIQPPAFSGHWIDEGQMFIDQISLLFVDLVTGLDSVETTQAVTAITSFAHKCYEQMGSPQRTIYITLSIVQRIAD